MADETKDLGTGSSPRMMTRREFLEMGAGALAGGIAAAVGYKFGGQLFADKGSESVPSSKQVALETIDISRLGGVEKQLVSDIRRYRECLGINGLPSELSQLINGETVVWPEKSEDFKHGVPEEILSYSYRLEEVLMEVLGENAGNLVKGTTTDVGFPFGLAFDAEKRLCWITTRAHDIPLEDFVDYVLHEACGHGSDPGIKDGLYPPEALLQVVHGKWRALARAFEIPGQFFNHPNDQMLPQIKKGLGETVGKALILNAPAEDVVTKESLKGLALAIEETAREVGVRPQVLKFNKRVCALVGAKLFQKIKEGSIRLKGNAASVYQESLESGCVEIYAEMVKNAILHPVGIRGDREIMEGISEVVAAISGRPTDLGELGSKIRNPGFRVLERHKDEEEMKTAIDRSRVLDISRPDPTVTAEDTQRLKKEKEKADRREADFYNFAHLGVIPDKLREEAEGLEELRRFADLYSKVVGKYPSLTDTFAQHLDEAFDPNLHIWEIREIEGAMDSGFVRRMLDSGTLDGENVDNLKKKSGVLSRFATSGSF